MIVNPWQYSLLTRQCSMLLGQRLTSFRLLCSLASENAAPIDTTDTDPSTAEKKLAKKYKSGLGGDVNMVSLLGTVTGVDLLSMVNDPERKWGILFLRTRVPRSFPEDQAVAGPQYRSASSRVHVFDRRLINVVRHIKVGDRLFVSGFLSYYKKLNQEEGARAPKTCAVVAQRCVPLGPASEPPILDATQVDHEWKTSAD